MLTLDDVTDLALGAQGRIALALNCIAESVGATERRRFYRLREALRHAEAARRLRAPGSAPQGEIMDALVMPGIAAEMLGTNDVESHAVSHLLQAAQLGEQTLYDQRLGLACAQLLVASQNAEAECRNEGIPVEHRDPRTFRSSALKAAALRLVESNTAEAVS